MLKTDSIQITPEILSLIARIDEFKGAWRALGTLAPDRLSASAPRGHHREHRLLHPHRGQQAVRPGGGTAAVESGDQILRHPRRAGSGWLCRADGLGVLIVAGHPVHREPHQTVASDPAASQREGHLASRQLQNQLEQRRCFRRNRRADRYRVSDRVTLRYASPDDGTGDLGEPGARDCPTASTADHRPVRRRFLGDTSLPGRQRAPLPGADHAPALAGRVRLRALQFVGKRDRTQQGSLLPGAAPDAGHDPHGVTELAAVAGVLSAVPGRADAASGEEGRAREDRAGGHA
jgi:hypothetical protein